MLLRTKLRNNRPYTLSVALPVTSDYQRLFLEHTPLLDVRAPVEFAAGAFPNAVNHPLINDQERHEVGLRYKEMGQAAALALGHELVGGDLRDRRIAAWNDFQATHPDAVLYCFRGGMRSHISQEWLFMASGRSMPRVVGGYKALRNYLLQELDIACSLPVLAIGGRTGCGKTLLLRRFQNAIDLEGLAGHRGSAFGRHATPQPTQINFENALAIELLRHRHRTRSPVLIEDESRSIGSIRIPHQLFDHFQDAPLFILEATLAQRVELTRQEYVVAALAEYQGKYGEDDGFTAWGAYLKDSLQRISKRLGGARYKELEAKMRAALRQHQETGEQSLHRDWIATLLSEYYDPMYDYQIAKNRRRIVAKGDLTDIESAICRYGIKRI